MSLPVHDRTVLRLIESQKATSQIEIAKSLHLRTNTVHGVIQKLLERGRIVPERTEIYGRGRPIQHYRIAQESCVVVFAYIGSQIYGGVVRDQTVLGEMFERNEAHQRTRAEAFAELRRDFREILRLAGVRPTAISRVIFNHGGSELEDRRFTSSISPWMADVTQEDYEKLFNRPVTILTDAMLKSELELRARVRENCHTLIIFNVGDGLSSVGTSYTGAWDKAYHFRGEMGHVVVDPNGPLCGCGHRGCLEALISGPALLRQIRQDGQKALFATTGYEMFEKLDALTQRGGNAYADAFLESFLDRCAWVVSLIVNLHNPDVIVMNGYAFQGRQHWLNRILEKSRRYILLGESARLQLEFPRTTRKDHLCALAARYDISSRDN